LGLINCEGNLVFRGRLKEMINRGGEKIAPVEVDSVLREHPEVLDAAAFGVAHSSLGEEVAAAVVLKDGTSVAEDELIRFSRRHLAHFKVPRRIVFLDALPRTATGKLVRHELTRRFQREARQAPHRATEIADHPPSSLETTLAKLWADTLGIKRVGFDEDFFLLGGDSLQAVALLADVRAVCGVELPIKSIFDDTPTVAGMARTIDSLRKASKSGQNGAARASNVVAIRTRGDLAPVFAVGGSGGHSIGFAHLAARLRPDHPFYGLDARGLDGTESPLTRIEDIASEHIRQMRRVRATGPYVLIGACFGGRVVFEMAQQLHGEAALVVLLDPSEPFKGLRFAPDTLDDRTGGFVRERLALYASELRRTPARSRPRYVWDKLAVLWGMIRARDPYRGDRSEYHRREVWRANKLAGRRYIAKPYRGPVAVFWTRERDGHEKRHRAEWATVIRNPVTTAFVPGRDSGEMLHAAHVGALAPHIDRCLHDMETASTGESSAVAR
ncbi:MAG: alpha/beta fold hydrolase, partial [Myxococcales bacterium]|nr:alpha/beta fold hydrolase [Myxococcales bacterium]